jgi:Flp pilus assembly protein TadD
MFVLEFTPGDQAARLNLANSFANGGKALEAAAQYQEVLRSDPDSLEALNNLAWLLATSEDANVRNGPEAVKLAERACELTHHETSFLGTLAAAYAEAGRFQDAIATAEKARTQAQNRGETSLEERNQQLLDLYRQGKPYHESTLK